MTRTRRLLTRSGDQFETSGEDWPGDTSYDLGTVKYVVLDEFFDPDGLFPQRIVVWEDGFISLGDVTQEQIDWVNAHSPSDSIYDFPGDFIFAGYGDIQQPVEVGVGFVDFDADPVTGEYSRDDAVRVLRITWQTEDFGFVQLQFTSQDFTIIDEPSTSRPPVGRAGFKIGTVSLDSFDYTLADYFEYDFDGHYFGTGDDDRIFGYVNDDVMEGNAGNDELDGYFGNDLMIGGPGDDVYHVDAPGDIVEENAGEGRDKVYLETFSYVLPSGVEDLTITYGFEPTQATGNALDNLMIGNDLVNTLNGLGGADTLFGNGGNDSLDGGGGADAMRGGLGDDTYEVDDTGDRTLELAGEGTDTVRSSVQHTLLANLENLVLTGTANINGAGNALANTISGNNGNNLLNGLAGADTMRGNGGNDTYIVDNVADIVREASAAGGTDLVLSSVSYTIRDNVENLTLTGSAAINANGNELANRLTGNNGANLLNGNAGADVMRGYAGNDTYVVDNSGDQVLESSAGGADVVQSSVSYTIRDNVETLTLTGSANINGAGNSLANTINGNAGNNLLNGLAGADVMRGGLGDDTYIVDNVRDQAIESSASGGNDRVQSSVTFALGLNIETLTLTGSFNINGTGNASANTINGNGGANQLFGESGNDVLRGGAGNDQLHGGLGNDSVEGGLGVDRIWFDTALNVATNVDTVVGYSVAEDSIVLENAIFTGLATGTLAASAFRTGAAAADADDRILYNAATGALLFDSDGVGGAAAVQFATLSAGLAMSAGEFTII